MYSDYIEGFKQLL